MSDGSCVYHRCIVLLLFVECMDLWQLVSTHYYIGYVPLHKASSIYLPILVPSSIWICWCKSTTFAVTKLVVWFCGL